jgi:hypothetical protein
MTRADFKPFTEEFALLAEVFNEPLSATRIQTYFMALDDLPLEQIVGAMRTAHGQLRFFPKPVELRELLLGSPEEQSEVAWSRARQAFQRGVGAYRPIDFEDPILHATVTAIGGWGRLHSLGFRGTEEVTVAVARKEFLQHYRIFLRRGAPVGTPAALCADPDPVFPEPLRLGDGFKAAVVPMLPAEPARRALAESTAPMGPVAVRELLNNLAAHHRPPELNRRHDRPPEVTPPSAADLEAHEAKKAETLRGLGANGSRPATAGEVVRFPT